MKVCFITRDINQLGGIPRSVSILANNLVQRGYDINILSFEKKYESSFFSLDYRVKSDFLFNFSINFKSNFLIIMLKIFKYLKNNSFDIVVIAGMDYTVFLLLSRLLIRKVKYIGWEHANYTVGKKFGFKWVGRKISNQLLDCTVVLTNKDKSIYLSNEEKINKICRIYNPIVYPDNKIICYKSEKKRIISCGALINQKGFDYLLDIAEIVFAKFPDWSWYIYGDGELYDELNEKIFNKSLTNNVFLKGNVKDMSEIYNEFSIFALTSRYEGFCMVMIEAMQHNLPVIAFNCNCGPDEIIENDVNGYLVTCFDIKMFADKLICLIEDENLRLSMSSKCKNSIAEFNQKKIVEDWLVLFENIKKDRR